MSMQDPRALVVPDHIGDIDYQDLILHPVKVFSAGKPPATIKYYNMIETIRDRKDKAS